MKISNPVRTNQTLPSLMPRARTCVLGISLLPTLALIALCGQRPARGQIGVEAWVQRFNLAEDYAHAMAVDTNGNVFVTGESFLGMHCDDVDCVFDYDYATIKYSAAGVPLWTKYYGGSNDDRAYGIALDGSGNVIVTGTSHESSYPYNSGYVTVKYSGEGVQLWSTGYWGGDSEAYFVAVDSNDNVFVTGYSSGGYLTIKYSGAGVQLWTKSFSGGSGGSYVGGIAVDGSGNVVVTGTTAGTNASPYHYDFATIKYSGAGVALWTNRYDGPGNGNDQASGVAVDSNGNVFVTGSSPGIGSSKDFATIKYSGAGVALWTNRYNGPGNGDDGAADVKVDTNGNVFVTGASEGSGSGHDYATIKYSGAGVPLWTNRYNGPANSDDYADGAAVDGSGNVVVTGSSHNGTNYDFVTIEYSGAGAALWTICYNGSGNGDDGPSDVKVDIRGNVFVTGPSEGSGSGYDYATIKYSSAIPPLLAISRTTTNTVAISWPSPSTGFTLQQNTDNIATPNWNDVLTMPTDNGTTKTVIVNPSTGNGFFRLNSQ
jgi:hypothetical protein